MTSDRNALPSLKSPDDLGQYRARLLEERDPRRLRVRVCMTGCRAFGAVQVRDALAREIEAEGLAGEVDLTDTGCHGFCAGAPVVGVDPFGFQYQCVQPEDTAEIVAATLKRGDDNLGALEWDRFTTKPSLRKLEELGLDDVADELYPPDQRRMGFGPPPG